MKTKMKSIMLMLLVCMMLITGIPSIAAAAPAKPIVVLVNYQKVDFPDNYDPFIIKGITMVPVRGAFEKMKAEVTWKKNSSGKIEVTAKHNNNVVLMTQGDKKAYINNKVVQMDQPADLRKGRLSVPLRFISEAFGGTVTWVPQSKSGHDFDYIRIEGQFSYPAKPMEVQTTNRDTGYGDPIEVTSLPVTIKYDKFNLTIHGVSNSLPLVRKKNSNYLLASATKSGQPDFGGLKDFTTGIIRFDVEFEANTDAGYQVDELQMGTHVMEVYMDDRISTVDVSMLDGNLSPSKFHGFLENTYLKKNQKARGIIPINYHLTKNNNKEIDMVFRLNTHTSSNVQLKFKIDNLLK